MHLDTIHHIAIIGHDYDKTREFYVDKLGFEPLDEHHRPEKQDILFNIRIGNIYQTSCPKKTLSPSSRAYRSPSSGF